MSKTENQTYITFIYVLIYSRTYLILIPIGKVKVDLDNFDATKQKNIYIWHFKTNTYSCRNFLLIVLKFILDIKK
jgi:hypothetical protein